MVILSIVGNKEPQDYYDWKPNNNASLKMKVIENSFKEMQRNYSSKLVKKIKALIFEGLDLDDSQVTNLTDSLQQLDEDYGRVLKKIKKIEGLNHY